MPTPDDFQNAPSAEPGNNVTSSPQPMEADSFDALSTSLGQVGADRAAASAAAVDAGGSVGGGSSDRRGAVAALADGGAGGGGVEKGGVATPPSPEGASAVGAGKVGRAWSADPHAPGYILDADGATIASALSAKTAALIVRAVNAHEGLVDVAKKSLVTIGEMTAVLGGEYADQYGPLYELLSRLEDAARSALALVERAP